MNWLLLLGKTFYFISFVMFVVTLVLFWRECKIRRSYVRCQGYVTGLREVHHAGTDVSIDCLEPIITYIVGGVSHRLQGSLYSHRPQIGDKVEILYCKDNVDKAVTVKGRFTAFIICLAVMICCLMTGYILCRVA